SDARSTRRTTWSPSRRRSIVPGSSPVGIELRTVTRHPEVRDGRSMRDSASAVVVVLALASVASGAGPAEKCAAAKLRAAAQKTSGLLECHARALQAPTSLESAYTTRVRAKFVAKWERIESRGGCAVNGDGDDVEARIDAFVADLVDAVPATTTTTTTTTTPATCPPTTALYCGQSGCGFGALCPAGM